MSSKHAPPRFTIGDRVGNLSVVEVITRSHYHPTTKRHYTKAHLWYWCICDCGATEVRTQGSLLQNRGEAKCQDCATQTYRQRVKSEQAQQAGPVPDFATMKLR